jgi:hypothetical protein
MITIIRLLLSLPPIFFLPGYLGVTFWFNKHKGDERVTFSKFIFLSLMGSIILSSWLGLVLAEIGVFSLTRLVLILWILCLFGAVLNKFKLKPLGLQAPKLSYSLFTLLFILAIGAYLFFQPHELILGGRDPGVYINTGINIAKTGSIFVQNKALALLNEQNKREFAQHFNANFMMGFYLADLHKARITPQFLHLFSLWYAIFYSLFGLSYCLYMPPFFALLSLWAVFLFCQEAFHSKIIALVAAGLLCINIIQIWFARFADSEIMAQFLLFAGLTLFSAFMEKSSKIEGLLAGLSLGLLFLLKIDLFLIIFAFLFLFGYKIIAGRFRKQYCYFLIPFLLLFFHALIHSFFFCRTYLYQAFRKMFRQQITLLELLTAAVISCIILLIVWKSFRNWIASLFAKKELVSRVAFIVALCLVLYGYFIRPDLLSAAKDINTHSFRWMGWFLHPVGLLLAIAGFLMVLIHCRNTTCFIWLFVVSLYSIQYFYKIKAFPDYYWLMRRFIPVVYPSAVIFISYLIYSFADKLKHRKLKLLPYLIVVLLGASYIHADLTILHLREFRGATAFIQKISNEIKGNALIISEGPSADLIHLISLPLWSISSKDVIELRRPVVNPSELKELFSLWLSHYDNIYLLSGRNVRIVEQKYYWGLIDEYSFQAPFMKYTYDKPPKKINQLKIKVSLRKLLTVKQLNPTISFIDIGETNDVLIKNGFYHREQAAGESFRWTAEEAIVYVPSLSSASNTLVMRMSGGRPESAKAAHIQVFINNVKIKELYLDNYFKEYAIQIPLAVKKQAEKIFPSQLKITSTVFIPAIEMGTADTRALGVMIDYIFIK